MSEKTWERNTAGIRFARQTRRTLANHLFYALLPQDFNAFAQVWLAVEICFAYASRLCYDVEINRLLLSQESSDGVFHALAFVLTTSLRVGRNPCCVTLPGLLTHGLSPAGSVDAAPILRWCTRVPVYQFLRQYALVEGEQ